MSLVPEIWKSPPSEEAVFDVIVDSYKFTLEVELFDGQNSRVPFYDVTKEISLLVICKSHEPAKVVAAEKRPPSLTELIVCTIVFAIDILKLDIDLM